MIFMDEGLICCRQKLMKPFTVQNGKKTSALLFGEVIDGDVVYLTMYYSPN